MENLIIVCMICALVAINARYLKLKKHLSYCEMEKNELREEFYSELDAWKRVARTVNAVTCRYEIVETIFGFELRRWCPDYPDVKILIKRFDDSDREYARNCAEELLDKLNEKI